MCGPISLQSLQRMEIIADTIRDANKNPYILPNVTIGFTMLDDCEVKRVSYYYKNIRFTLYIYIYILF